MTDKFVAQAAATFRQRMKTAGLIGLAALPSMRQQIQLAAKVEAYFLAGEARGIARDRAKAVLDDELQLAQRRGWSVTDALTRARTRVYSLDTDASRWCPCGHWTGGDYQCLNGRIYGPCGTENCTGVCDDTHGRCRADGCLCEEDA